MDPITIKGMEIVTKEWCDEFFLRYGIEPPDLPQHYGGFRVGLSIHYDLDCNKGGFVTDQHNELRDVSNKTNMHDNPFITPGRE